MCKFIHSADWHLGARGVPQSVFLAALEALKKTAKSHSADFILCVGDVFDRERPDQRTKDMLLKFLLDSSDLFFVFTVGNHDYENKDQTYHSLQNLKLLSEYGVLRNVTVIEPGQEFVNEDGVVIRAEDCWEDLYRNTATSSIEHTQIKTFHGPPPDKSVFFDGDFGKYMLAQNQQMLSASGANYIALGDIHKNAHPYCGSLVCKTYSCEDGVVYVDLKNNKIVRIGLDIPKKITWDLTEIQSATEDYVIDGLSAYPDGNFIRVKTALPLPAWAALDKDKIKHGVKHKDFYEVKFMNSSPIESVERKIPDSVRRAKTLGEEIDGIIDDDSYGLNKKELKSTCKEYL